MSTRLWRWEERDFGFRFRTGSGRARRDHYQGRSEHDYYVIAAAQCKLASAHVDRLAKAAMSPRSPRVVANPWRCYDRDWDWIVSEDDICLNWAGCLDRQEIDRREDEGVARAMESVVELLGRDVAVPVDLDLVKRVHRDLMDAIYPFAGRWRTVELTKGEGPVKWPLPRDGIQPLMDDYAEKVLSRTPFLSLDDGAVFTFVAEAMGELLAIHPFREGNGRIAFILGNLLLMQNDLLPLDLYDRRTDKERYYAACERSRIHVDHGPLAGLIAEWQDRARERWEPEHGL